MKFIHAEAFNEVCEALNKVHNAQRTIWGMRVPVVLWAYRTACKKLIAQPPMRMEYEENVVIPIENEMPGPRMAAPADTTIRGALEEVIAQLNEAECLGPEEEIQQGNFRLQELGKESVST